MEKEVLGIYISGHPLEADRSLIEKNITAVSSDFIQDEETGMARVRDQAIVTVAGMIAAKTVKTTKTNQMMAFLTLEDLRGTLEVIVFPKDYRKISQQFSVQIRKFLLRAACHLEMRCRES